MVDLLDKHIDVALEKGRTAHETEPRAAHAWFDEKEGRVTIELTNGVVFGFPPELAEGLAGASAKELSEVEILGSGNALHWKSLDADFSVPNLLNGVFGTSRWMAARAGSATSERKAAAARENGAKGGRPRKESPSVSKVQFRPSRELAAITGNAPLPRSQIISKVWDHIRRNNLQNPTNKREILADDKLRRVFGGKERVSMFEMNKELSKHLGDGSVRTQVDKSSPRPMGKTGRRRA